MLMKIHLKHNERRKTCGSVILEGLITSSIVGTMGCGLIGSFSYGFMAMQMVRENQRATQIILEKVETLRLYSWDQVLTPNFIPATFDEVFDPQSSGTQTIMYQGTMDITTPAMGTSYASSMREFLVTVSWTSVNGEVRTRTLSTYIAKDGLQNYVY